MKILITAGLLLLSFTLAAQEKKLLFPFNPLEKELNKTFVDKYLKKKNEAFSVNYIPVKPKRPQLLVLPLDNMPCLVPDTRDFNMPVLKLKTAGFIPAAR